MKMPILSTFFGIVIRVFHGDHNPPHIHVDYAEFEAIIEIRSGKILAGKLPPRASKLFEEWRALHLKALEKAWAEAQADKVPARITPLE